MAYQSCLHLLLFLMKRVISWYLALSRVSCLKKMGDYHLLKCSGWSLGNFFSASEHTSFTNWDDLTHSTNTLKIKTLRSNIASFSQNSDMIDNDSYWFCNSQQNFFSYLLLEPVFQPQVGAGAPSLANQSPSLGLIYRHWNCWMWQHPSGAIFPPC